MINSKKVLLVFTLLTFTFTLLADDIYVIGKLSNQNTYSESNSLAFIDSDQIDSINVTELNDILSHLANTNIATGSNRSQFIQIRGIGERSSYEGMPNSSVGVYIDDIDYTGIQAASAPTNTESIKLYKGPQSSLYGSSALAGVLHLKTKAPQKKHSYKLSQTISSFNTLETSIESTGSLSERLTHSLSYSKNISDGFISNTYKKSSSTNAQNEDNLKLNFNYRIGHWNLLYSYHNISKDNGYDIFNHSNNYTSVSDKPGKDIININTHHLKLVSPKLNNFKYTTLFTFINNSQIFAYDEDWGNNKAWNALSGWNKNYDYNIEFQKKNKQYHLEQVMSSDRLRIGYFLKQKNEYFSERAYKNSLLRSSVRGNYHISTFGFFLNKQFKLGHSNTLSAGTRVERWLTKYDDTAESFSPKSTLSGFELTFTREHSSMHRSYVKLSKGYKAGGVNTQSKVKPSLREFKDESLYSLEFGNNYSRYNFELDTTLFSMYRQNAQVKSSYQDDPSDPSSYTFYTDNATSAHIYGLESQINYDLTPRFQIMSSLGLLKSKFNDYQLGSRSLTNRDLPHAPKFQFSILTKYLMTENFFATLSFSKSGSFYYSNSHDQKSSSKEIVDMGLNFNKSSFNLLFFIKNLLNTKYSNRGYFFSNEPPSWEESLYEQVSSPQTIGIKASYTF